MSNIQNLTVMKTIRMNNGDEKQLPETGVRYEPPQVEAIEVEVEKGFQSTIEGFEEGEEHEWES